MGQVGPVFIDHVFMNAFSRNASNDKQSLPLYNRPIAQGIFYATLDSYIGMYQIANNISFSND